MAQAKGACLRPMRLTSLHHARRADQRVAAAVHRRRAGMGFLPGQGQLVPALALGVGDHADGLVLGLEDRPLLDMRLEIGADRALAHRLGAGIADALQLLAHGLAVGIGAGQPVVLVEYAGEHARGDHGRGEARAFLVGPHRDLDRRLGLVAEIVEAAHHFEPGQHAIDAVEACRRSAGCRDGCPSPRAAGHCPCPGGGRRCCRCGRR